MKDLRERLAAAGATSWSLGAIGRGLLLTLSLVDAERSVESSMPPNAAPRPPASL